MIEPTETESKAELDTFLDIMELILNEIHHEPEQVQSAPHQLRLGRVNEVYAAKNLDLSDHQCLDPSNG